MGLLRAIATVGGMTAISRVLGFVRDILIAAILGAGWQADAFFVAFKFPNLFRRLFAEGAFNAAFVPLFAGALEARGLAAARRFAEHALAVLLWTLLVFVGLVQLFMPIAMMGFAPGFISDPEQFDLAVLLTRLTFPYLLFISLVSLMAGVLNALGRFWAAAATPILLNLSLIGCILWLAAFTPSPAHALAWGVALGGAAQFVWMFFHCRLAGVRLRLPRPRLAPEVREMLRRILPAALGAGIYQVNLLVDTIIASLLPKGAISYLFFADRVNQLPLGIVGVAVGTALLPMMSRQLQAGDARGALESQNRALELALFLALPAAVALMVIAEPIIAVLFERRAFGVIETAQTAPALAIYAAGLPAYILIKALTPGFFARGDTAMPVKLALIAALANLVLNLALMGPFKHLGIAAATAVSAWLNAFMLALILKRRGQFSMDQRLRRRLGRLVLASLLMGGLLAWLMALLAAPLAGGIWPRIGALALLVGAGLLAYLAMTRLAGCWTLTEVKRFFLRDAA